MNSLYTARTDLVMCAGRDPVASGDGAVYAVTSASYEYLTNNQYSRIRQTGNVVQIRVYIASLTNLASFKIRFWRKVSSSAWSLLGSQTFLPAALTAGEVNTLMISPAIAVQEGDYYGVCVTATGGGNTSPFTNFTSSQTNATLAFITEHAGPTVDWSTATPATVVFPCDVLIQAPQVVMIGDSTTGGSPTHYSYVDDNLDVAPPPDAPADAYPAIFAALAGCTFQNMGVRYSTSSLCAARWTRDVVNVKPRYVAIMMGLTDIGAAVSFDDFKANYAAVLDSCVANNIIPIVIKILPCSELNEGQNTNRVTWNAWLDRRVKSYRKHVLLDLETLLTGASVDPQCHPVENGYTLLGAAVYAALLASDHVNQSALMALPRKGLRDVLHGVFNWKR